MMPDAITWILIMLISLLIIRISTPSHIYSTMTINVNNNMKVYQKII